MTFIPAAVCSSYRGCEKTFVIPKPRVNFIPRSGRTLLYRKRVKGEEGRWKRNPFTRLKFWILDDRCMQQWHGAAWSSATRISRQLSYAGKWIPDEPFC